MSIFDAPSPYQLPARALYGPTGPGISCHLDYETRGTVDLNKLNAYVYAEHPGTDIWCAQIAFGDENPFLWIPGMPVPPRLIDHILEGGELVCWNAAFERLITREIAGPRYGWPIPADGQWRCVMVESYAMNLPGKLEKAGPALGLSDVKDAEGHRLMLQMSKPRRIEPDGTIVWWDDAGRRERLYAYCAKDVIAERAAEKRLFRLIPEERRTWLLDLKMNDRGVYIDAELCTIAKRLAGEAMERLDAEMHAVTDGDVSACSNVGQLIKWLKAQGVDTDTVKKDALADLLAREDISPSARRALELRKAGSKTSTAKIDKLLSLRQADGRMRGSLQFGGAAQTFRWAGRGAQLQNLPRPEIRLIAQLVETLQRGDLDWLEMVFGDPMSAIADAIRSMVMSAPDRVLLDADFSNIEGRAIAWLAGEETKLARFRAFDAGTGPDVYLVAAAGIYNVPIAAAKPHRQVGKVAELALGFGGGPGAFAKMAANYGLKVADTFDTVWGAADDERRERAVDGYKQRGRASGLSERGWLAAECIKLAWRGDHPQTVALWRGLEDAAIAAVQDPDRGVHTYRAIKYRMVGSFLFCLLPSGRALSYPYPRIEQKKVPWKNADGSQARKPGITFKSEDSVTRQWGDKDFYGGLAAENCLAGDTEVLTNRGWRRLDEVSTSDKVWDGVQWASHRGVANRGFRPTGWVWGVRMTADHLILTDVGWRCASQNAGHHRAPVRLAYGVGLCGFKRPQVSVAGSMRLRDGEGPGRHGSRQGQRSELRVQASRMGRCRQPEAWDVGAPGLRGVALAVGAVPESEAQGVQELWRPGHHGVPGVEPEFRGVLARHGADVPAGSDDRARGQLERLLAGELRLARLAGAGPEHPIEPRGRHTEGPDAGGGGRGGVGHRRDHATVPAGPRVPDQSAFRPSGLHEPVFDVVNAGPLHRFTVRGADGVPFLVHNCTQAMARDVMRDAMHRVEAAGFETVLTVHDEILTETTPESADLERFKAVMAEVPAWCAGLPIAVDGWVGERFRK